MARYDKYEPKGGGFRAPLAADYATKNVLTGVGLDVNGHVVVGAGTTGIIGVMCLPRTLKATQIADIMTDGDIVDVEGELNPGEAIFSDAAGALSTTNTGTYVGSVVGDRNGPRLVVRVGRSV